MSSKRKVPLIKNEYYHIFNRGVARMPIFLSRRDYKQAMLCLWYYTYSKPRLPLSQFKKLSLEERGNIFSSRIQEDKLVEIVAFCLMPNHFHFLLKQLQEKGITNFVSNFSNSYTRYFNTVHNRVGPVYQGTFKSVHIETTEQLLHLSRYIHLNPVASNVIPKEELLRYSWSSLPDYLNGHTLRVSPEIVLQNFKSREDYQDFVLDYVSYAQELEKTKHLLLE